MLTFIFVETFDLHVENRIRVDAQAETALDFVRQHRFVVLFDTAVFVAETGVVHEVLHTF